LQRIEIIDGGFDYVNKPTVTITGGNGVNASADINMISVDHNAFFNAESTSTNVNLFTDTIGFSTYHKFRDYERVIYLPDNQKGLLLVLLQNLHIMFLLLMVLILNFMKSKVKQYLV
jgi:hypothetical protein